MTNLVEMSATDARRITDQIKAGVEAVWHLIEQAYTTRAWSALGYSSWDDYCTREFGTSRLRLPREERSEVVASLRESGLSIRAIASATGLGDGTVRRSLEGAPFGAPEPKLITGTDGKTYTPKPRPVDPEPMIDDEPEPEPLPPGFNPGDLDALNTPAPATPKRKPLTDSFFEAAYDLQKIAERIERLASDDRFEKNSGQIAQKNLGELTRSRDALQRVINQLSQA
ncbi:hypothetical protein M1M07_23880 [Rhodococcus sp. HM1]|uniref:hypothetical protein n=1 Tax=Rhodococcus sp. HM1 TaxID=2937759 RepID=UPI002009EE17|nr:hypothetical protein [Rhodococcus sp. HM1]MCK8674138.1 hypothetical protein [Rhodococcus sp. HM1]